MNKQNGIKLKWGMAFGLVLSTGAMAADAPGVIDFGEFVIRNANADQTVPTITERADETGFTGATPLAGQKIGYGTNFYDGELFKSLQSVNFTVDAGSAASQFPYLNIWVTDGTHSAVIALGETFAGLDLQTERQWMIYEYSDADLASNDPEPSIGWLFNTDAGAFCNVKESSAKYHYCDTTLSSFGDNIIIDDPGIYPVEQVGTGAPKGGYGLNLIWGDTAANYLGVMNISGVTVTFGTDDNIAVAGGGVFEVCSADCEYSSVQHAIDAAHPGATIAVYPGDYTELANYNPTDNTNSGTTNPVGLLVNKSVSIIGVTDTGELITDRENIAASVISGGESNWGTNFFVTAGDVLISGLQFEAKSANTDSASGPTTVNKAIEITADGFVLQHSVVAAAEGFNFDGDTSTALYFGNGAPDNLNSFTVNDNHLYGGITITNGAGDGSGPVDFTITNNDVSANHFMRVRGVVDGVAWLNLPARVPQTITGNDLSDVTNYILQVWGADAETQINSAFVASLINNNTLGAHVYVLKPDASLSFFDYSEYGGTAPAFFLEKSIQDAVTFAASGDTIHAGSGAYAGTAPTGIVTVDKPLTIVGDGDLTIVGDGNDSKLTGSFLIDSDGVTITGMAITNPPGQSAFQINSRSNIKIVGNNIQDIGTARNQSTEAIYIYGGARAFSGIQITDNDISNIGNPTANYTHKAIHFGDAGGTIHAVSGITITDNRISDVNSMRGGYGVSLNYGSSNSGSITGLKISGNTISDITGSWVHAIGLETGTPSAQITENIISLLTATNGTDEAGVFLEDNANSASVEILHNIFDATMEYGVALYDTMTTTANATHNYWGDSGGPAIGAKAGPGVDFAPWYISTTFNANQLSNFVEPSPPPPPPAPVGEEVSDIIDEVEIPDAESGETISEEAVTVIEEAATASTALAESVIENIETATTDSAIGALDVIGGVLDITGNAASNTTATSNTAASDSVTTSGAAALGNFAQVIAAIDTKATTSATVLTPVQKESVQAATVTAAAAAVKVLAATPTPAVAQQVLASLSNIITSNVNMGVSLTAAQADTLEDAAEQATDPDADLDTQLGTSVTIKPVNKEVISKTLLTEALAGSGVTEAQLDTFLAELAAAINPASVVVGDTNGEEALTEGFNNSLGGSEGSVGFDAETGVTTFTIGGSTETEELNGRSISALTADLVIPARVISSNVVATSFPDGIKVLANGSVVITSNQIASVVVPASYDPINFFADLNSKGTVSVDDTGNILLTAADFRFSGTFDYTGVGQGEPAATTTVTLPTGANESDPGYVFTITYRDGTTQTLQPYLEADAFVASAQSRGLDVKILRNTGIVLVSGRQFRPSYFVDALDAATEEFFNSNKDASGVAYRPLDVNADGKLDYEVITATGVQVAYCL